MIEQIKWESVYELWKIGDFCYTGLLSRPISIETLFVEHNNQETYLYGYDWIQNGEVQNTKRLIKDNPIQFLYFTEPSNKGTIHTAGMLAEAKDDEETAAIWIAATAKELYKLRINREIDCYVDKIFMSTYEFLESRFFLWHHAMTKLVPEIMIPMSVLSNLNCKNDETFMGLIKMNTVLLMNTWSIVRYSSLKDEEINEFKLRKVV